MERGVVELEVGMGLRSIPVDDLNCQLVWGADITYIPWSEGDSRFEFGKKGNRVVSLKLTDLSRAVPDYEIK
jgi:phosphopantothenate synthetase